MFWIISYKKYLVYSSTLAVILILLLIALFYPNLGSYNPITYFNIKGVVTGSIQVNYGIEGISFLKGLLILLFTSLYIFFSRLYIV